MDREGAELSCAQDGSRAGPERRRIAAVLEQRPVVGCETRGDVRLDFVPSVGWVVVWAQWVLVGGYTRGG
jgi:hypothetical protein